MVCASTNLEGLVHEYMFVRIVPNYELAPDLQSVQILRVVVRETMSEAVSIDPSFTSRKMLTFMIQLVDRLVADIIETTEDLKKQDSPTHALAQLGSLDTHSNARQHHGGLQQGSGSESSSNKSSCRRMGRPRPSSATDKSRRTR